jgi:hypothetical protein
VRRAALLALLLGACAPAEDTGLSLVARREGEGYLIWGRTAARAPLELSVEDGERVLFGPVPLLLREGRFRADIALEPTRSRTVSLHIADAAGTREWRVELPRRRREVRFGPPLPADPPPPEILAPAEQVPLARD